MSSQSFALPPERCSGRCMFLAPSRCLHGWKRRQWKRQRNWSPCDQDIGSQNFCTRAAQDRTDYDEVPPQRTLLDTADGSRRVYESDNMWDYKPAWCQPVTIIGSGTGFVVTVYQLSSHSGILTCIAALPIVLWWYVFLIAVPKEFSKYVRRTQEEQRDHN